MCGHFVHGNREICVLPAEQAGRIGKVRSRTPMMDGTQKSDGTVIPEKGRNAGRPGDDLEGRVSAKENSVQPDTCRTQGRGSVTQGLDRVREKARESKEERFTALLHHVTKERLEAAYRGLNRRAAPGVDATTWEEFGREADTRIKDLHDRVHRGTYRPAPSRRVYIPKPDGRQRPLGIASIEDKVVQQAVVEVLNAIYEVDFLGFSYGFRPKRSAHQALDALVVGIESRNVNWVLDADIKGFFDAIDHEQLMACIEQRVGDRRILRLIGKWLRAGVMEDGSWIASEKGTPQGATISPLLANVYLHYVFDLWAHEWRGQHARGNVVIVRYADDFVVGFEHRDDAERFLDALRARMAAYKLDLHPDKTRLIAFGERAARDHWMGRGGRPGSFNFLGFTHTCTRTRKGRFLIRRQTIARKMAAKLKEIKTELKRRCNHSVKTVGRWLSQVLRGYYQYHAVPTNHRRLRTFRAQVRWLWGRMLRRRSQRHRLSAKRLDALSSQFLPLPRILHPWPNQAFHARIQGKSPVR